MGERERDVEAWRRLCGLLDEDELLLDEVSSAAGDPAGFLSRNRGRLEERGIETPDQIDPWLVMIDGLDDAGALAYLEWTDTGVELAEALAGVPRVLRSGAALDDVEDVEGRLEEAIAEADRLLAASGLRIVFLEEDADACPLVVVPAAHVDEILELAARFGREARTFG